MKLQSQLLGKLHELSTGDRAWIVERLSEQERAQLFATLSAPDAQAASAQPSSDASFGDVVKVLARVEPHLVAEITKNEPAWLNAALAAAQHETWSKAFLDALPAALRAEAARAASSQFGPALTESVTRLILERCDGSVPIRSAFDRLVERLSSARSKRRMTLHL